MFFTVAAEAAQKPESSSRMSSSDSSLKPTSIQPAWPRSQKSKNVWRTNFQYNPLDYSQHSIRLVRIIPESVWKIRNDLRCEIRHATIDDIVGSYVCLSYVWGEFGDRKSILLNGATAWVQPNLWHFLHAARKLYSLITAEAMPEWLWIDALCIDQSNALERNHQVQQMGLIYSEAERVLAWLGNSHDIARFLRYPSGTESYMDGHDIVIQPMHPTVVAIRNANTSTNWLQPVAKYAESQKAKRKTNEYRAGRKAFLDSPYWTRAWITQELALASNITLFAGSQTLDMKRLPLSVYRPADMSLGCRIMDLEAMRRLHGESLLYLLDRFRSKECGITRDRIFSLLAICGEGGGLNVEYGITHEELMVNVLSTCDTSLCLCAFELLSSVLDIHDYSSVEDYFPFAEIRVPASSVRTAAIKSTTSKARSVTTIRMMDICDVYRGYLVVLGDSNGYIGVLYDHSEQQSYRSLWKSAWRRGCTITKSKNKGEYRVQLSFAVLLELSLVCSRRTRDVRDEDFVCCVQVKTSGTTVADKRPSLRKASILCLCDSDKI